MSGHDFALLELVYAMAMAVCSFEVKSADGANFMGWGGSQVNDAERAMLAQIADILQVNL